MKVSLKDRLTARKHLSGGNDLDFIILGRDHNAAVGFKIEVLLASHLASALHNVVALTRLKALVHVTTVNSVSPTLHPHQHAASSPAAVSHMHESVC